MESSFESLEYANIWFTEIVVLCKSCQINHTHTHNIQILLLHKSEILKPKFLICIITNGDLTNFINLFLHQYLVKVLPSMTYGYGMHCKCSIVISS